MDDNSHYNKLVIFIQSLIARQKFIARGNLAI